VIFIPSAYCAFTRKNFTLAVVGTLLVTEPSVPATALLLHHQPLESLRNGFRARKKRVPAAQMSARAISAAAIH
jgi:hypothetical protein